MYRGSHQALHCTSLRMFVSFKHAYRSEPPKDPQVFRFGPARKPRCCQAVTPAQLRDASAAERRLSEVQGVT